FLCDNPPTNACAGDSAVTGSSHTLLNRPADLAVDPANGDVYIADGYGNHRVVVFDKNGNFLRQMGGTGTGAGQFAFVVGGHPHCVVLGKVGLIYAFDRGNDRINVFQKDGTFALATPIVPGTCVDCLGLPGSARASINARVIAVTENKAKARRRKRSAAALLLQLLAPRAPAAYRCAHPGFVPQSILDHSSSR